jgi:hypothetical protein
VVPFQGRPAEIGKGRVTKAQVWNVQVGNPSAARLVGLVGILGLAALLVAMSQTLSRDLPALLGGRARGTARREPTSG